jgi:acyl-[acyl-carrier-protein]-phospholipid O-acyltransferase/long-chain-fatty-acid--[acyl-carrier-protein] ligase
VRTCLRFLLRLLYRFTAYNEAVLQTPGPVLLLPNHVSWWDWVIIGVCLDEDWKFVTSRNAAEASWLHKKIAINGRTFPVDMNSPYAIKHMAEYLQKGGRLVLFPEGRLSRTGSLMKLYDGTGFLLSKTHARVITAYIRGAHKLPYSPNPGFKQWFPRVSVHFSPVQQPPNMEHAGSAENRTRHVDWVSDRMVRQRFETETELGPRTLPAAITAAARERPGRTILEDFTLKRLTYRTLCVGARLLGERWTELIPGPDKRVGLLLPNVNAMPVTLLSLWAAGKIPAMLNYSTGPAVLQACAQLAELKQVVTSRAFLAQLKLAPEIFESAGLRLLFLEDVRPQISPSKKLAAFATSFVNLELPSKVPPDETAVILFTSGSEGTPKGVELTHQNLLANIHQMLSVVDLWESDRFFNALPLFHSFGLAIGLLLPLVHRVFVFLYPSPLHYRVIPSAFYNLDCTALFGTNTFLAGYARKAHPYDFHGLRYVFAGAEKLQESTSRLWSRKFGVRILEGYGATECGPCVSANTPLHPRHGSAGRFLPAIEFRLEPVEGIEPLPLPGSGSDPQPVGRLFVRGPNIMRGYLNPEANSKFQALGGWYDTGDIASVDHEGFLHILGRLKRFAKISGEMISLTAVEDALAGAFPQFGLRFSVAVVAKPDEAKGEKLVAVTNEPKLTLENIRDAMRARGLTNLAIPREIKLIHEIPRLGTGKVNHRELERLL